MDPVTASLIGGGISSGVNLFSAISTNQARAREADKARDWSEYMASTNYQRKVADLKAAGLNPLLALGSPHSPIPGGIQAQGLETPRLDASQHIQSALQARLLAREDELKKTQVSNVAADTALKKAQAYAARQGGHLSQMNAYFSSDYAELARKRTLLEIEKTRLARWDVHSAEARAKRDKREAEIDYELMQVNKGLQLLRNSPRLNYGRYLNSRHYSITNK